MLEEIIFAINFHLYKIVNSTNSNYMYVHVSPL